VIDPVRRRIVLFTRCDRVACQRTMFDASFSMLERIACFYSEEHRPKSTRYNEKRFVSMFVTFMSTDFSSKQVNSDTIDNNQREQRAEVNEQVRCGSLIDQRSIVFVVP
jgi:hypothetical protein